MSGWLETHQALLSSSLKIHEMLKTLFVTLMELVFVEFVSRWKCQLGVHVRVGLSVAMVVRHLVDTGAGAAEAALVRHGVTTIGRSADQDHRHQDAIIALVVRSQSAAKQ